MRGLIPGVPFTEAGSSAISVRVALVRIAARAVLGTFFCLWSTYGCADALLPSAIRAQPLASALAEFAHQTGLQLVYMSDALQKQDSKGSRAGVPASEALVALLDGTGLTFEFLNDRAVRIFPTPPHSEGSSAGPGPSAPLPGPRPNQLEQVDVMGLREKERLRALAEVQSVPTSLSVVSGEFLAAQKSEQLVDYAASVPGMNVLTSGAPGQAIVSIRGIAAPNDAASVAFYIDDTPIGGTGDWAYASSLSLDLMSYDLERLEVWRGPQGTSIGADSEIGLVRYALIPPNLSDFRASIAADVSTIHGAETPGKSIFGAVNVPVVGGQLGLRVSVYDSYTPGYIDNLYSGARGINVLEQRAGRIAARWQPTEAISIAVNAVWNRIASQSMSQVTFDKTAVVPNTGDAYFLEQLGSYGDLVDRTALLNPQNKSLDLYSMSLHWTLPLIDVKSTTAWSRNDADYQIDSSDDGLYFPAWSNGRVPIGLAVSRRNIDLNKFSEELHVASVPAGRFGWMVGGFYTHETSLDSSSEEALDDAYRPIAFFAPNLGFNTSPADVKEWAVFGNATWHITRQAELGGGIRVAHYDQSGAAFFGGWNMPTIYGSGSTSETDTTWAGWASYRIIPSVMLYGRVATGLVPGQTNGVAGVPPVGHDTVTNYELGLKVGSPRDTAVADLSVFYIDWKDIQVTNSAGNFVNGAHATSRGFELTGSYAPVENLQLTYNADYTKCEFDSMIPDNPILPGYQFPNVPKWSVAGTAAYAWPLAGLWHAQLLGAFRWIGLQFDSEAVQSRSLGGSPTMVIPSYAVINVNAQVSNGSVAFRLFARNLTDKRAYLNRLFFSDVPNAPTQIVDKLLQPRTLGVGVSYVF
jgi:outer membrane receptor protein involved in Fe transport